MRTRKAQKANMAMTDRPALREALEFARSGVIVISSANE
jgi:hypothetical protein